MVKVNGPFMSLDASGTLADTLTASKWKGRNYIRQRIVPSNPRSVMQVAIRAMFKFLSQAWAGIGTTPQGSWADRAGLTNISPFNAYMSRNQALWREFSPPSQTDPNPGTGTPPVLTLDSAVGGAAHIDLTFTLTTANGIWGVMIFRSPTGSFTTSLANCIAIIPMSTPGAHVYTDSDLAAGTYYYDARAFTTEGVLGAEEGEQSGTAT